MMETEPDLSQNDLGQNDERFFWGNNMFAFGFLSCLGHPPAGKYFVIRHLQVAFALT